MTGQLLRYRDLEERGIVRNRVQLKNLVDRHGFPAGRMAGPNSRVWFAEEVYSWLEALPSALEAKPPLKGAIKKNVEAAKARREKEAA